MPPVAVTEFQDALTELAARSGEASDRLLARISALSPAEARAFITDAYPALLTPYLAGSAQLTTQWYAEQPVADAKPGAKVFVPTPAPVAEAGQLAVSGRWALTQATPSVALRGNATRQVFNASRQTVTFNARAEGARWIRQAKRDACGFCKMLATRAVLQYDRFKGRDMSYTGRGVQRKRDRDGNLTNELTLVVTGRSGRPRGKRKIGSEYHDHCRCTAVPLRDGIYEPPDYVDQWTDEYIDAFEKFGGDAAKISQQLDLGRIRPDRATAAAKAAAPTIAEAAATSTAAAPAAAPASAPTNIDRLRAEAQAATAAGDTELANRLLAQVNRLEETAEFRVATANLNLADIGAQLDAKQLPAQAAAEAADELDEMDRLLAEATALIDAGDFEQADILFERAEVLQRAQADKAAKVAAKKAADDADTDAKWERVSALIDEGVPPVDAESDVFGISVESIRRRDFIATARRDGHQGAGFDELVASVHARFAEEQYYLAETATNGQMLKPQYQLKISARQLWTVNDATARKYMSDEMAAWFDSQGGRVTRPIMRDSILSGRDYFDLNTQSDFLQ